ncbi:MAG: hypothetical protein ABWY25_03590 [Paenisporosarcina sp.]
MNQKEFAREYSREVLMHAESHGQRTGQYLFNGLPDEARFAVRGRLFDPFHKQMSQYSIEDWLMEHVIFNNSGAIVAIFDDNNILWERIP